MPHLPHLSRAEMEARLAPPQGRARVVVDTDCANEIDDQFALAWALLSPEKLDVEGVYAEPFSFQVFAAALLEAYELTQRATSPNHDEQRLVERFHAWLAGMQKQGVRPQDMHFDGPDVGMERSYHEILNVFGKLGIDPGQRVKRGATRYLPSRTEPVPSEAAEHLIACAMRDDDRPLYVAAIGCLTNVASAILMEPEIVRRIVVTWTAGYPTWVNRSNIDSFNMVQDMHAAQVIFECGVPVVYIPGFHIGAQLRLSLPEVEAWVKGQGAMGDYLHWLFTHNPIARMLGIEDHFARSWVIWDLVNVAWLLNADWIPSDVHPGVRLQADTFWQTGEQHLPMREAFGIDRDAIFRDLFFKLQKAATHTSGRIGNS